MANYPYKAVQTIDLRLVLEAMGSKRDTRNPRLWRHKNFYVHDQGHGHFYDMTNKTLGYGAVQLVCLANNSNARAAEVWLSNILRGIEPDLKRQELAQYTPRTVAPMDCAGVANKRTLRELCIEAENRYGIPGQLWMRGVQGGYLSFPSEGDRLIFLRRNTSGVTDGGEVLPLRGPLHHYPLVDRPRLKPAGSRLSFESCFYVPSPLGYEGPVGVFPNALEAMCFATLSPRFSVMSVGDIINIASTEYFLRTVGRNHTEITFWMPDTRAGKDGSEILVKRFGLRELKTSFPLARSSWVDQLEASVIAVGGIEEFIERRRGVIQKLGRGYERPAESDGLVLGLDGS